MTTKPKTADELAAEAAESMFKSGGRASMTGQPITQQHAEQAPAPGERHPVQPAEDPVNKGGGAGGMPTSTAAATGGFTDTAGGKVLDKADNNDEGDGEEYGEEEMEKMEGGGYKHKKSGKMYSKGKGGKYYAKSDEPADQPVEEPDLDADALMKSMDALDAAAEGIEEPEIDRRAELAKSFEDGTLTDEERVELLTLLGGEQPTPASEAVNKSGEPAAAAPDSSNPEDGEPMAKGFEDVFAEEFGDDYDVSPFLDRFGHAVGAAMDIMREDLTKSSGDQQRFNRALSKSFRGVATIIQSQQEMVKSLSAQNTALAERLGVVEQQPVGRKSVASPQHAQPLNKSFADSDPGDGPNREQIFNGLHLLMAKYKNTGGRAKNGEPIDRAMSAFELTGNISKSLLGEVKDVLGGAQQ